MERNINDLFADIEAQEDLYELLEKEHPELEIPSWL